MERGKEREVPPELRAPCLQPDCGASGVFAAVLPVAPSGGVSGNGNLLQYPCPGNPMDRGAWRATTQEVTRVNSSSNGSSKSFSLSCDQQLTWIWSVLWEKSLVRSVERASVMAVGAAWLSTQDQSDRKATEGLCFCLVQAPHPVYCITQTFI